jgi:hypothetical protein
MNVKAQSEIYKSFLAYFPYFEEIKEAYEFTLLTVFLCVLYNAARQRLDKQVPTATNTHKTTEELLDAVFFVRSVFNQTFSM